MKKNNIFASIADVFAFSLVFALIFSLSSCAPKISIEAQSGNSVKIGFSTSFPEETARALRKMAGAGDDIPIFAEEDVRALLLQAGGENSKVLILPPNGLESSTEIKNISENVLSACKIVLKSKNSLSLSIGPEQFKNFYDLLTDEFKSYFDLMMIPSLIGEKMTTAEYEELLSSMYGPGFAKDIVSGTLEISLSSPDGAKTVRDSVTLGEILTAAETKTWSVSW